MSKIFKKKAKLAHEKRGQVAQEPRGHFTFARVVDLVAWPTGEMSALVDLDGNETMALVSQCFVTQHPETGEWMPGRSACPAIYDRVARARAIERYESYKTYRSAAQSSDPVAASFQSNSPESKASGSAYKGEKHR